MKQCIFLCFLAVCYATHQDNGLDFMTIGDWGDTGAKVIAPFMGDHDADWILSTGDNFYNQGVSGVDDPQFKSKFEDTFTAPSTKVPWYVCAGNHDYYGGNRGIEAEIQYSNRSSRWKFPSYYYDFIKTGKDSTTVHVLSIDTWRLNGGDTYIAFNAVNNTIAIRNKTKLMVKMQQGDLDSRTYNQMVENIPEQDASRPVVSTPDQKQYDWIKSTLAASKADWKIVMGHFPVRSATTGEHGETKSLVANLMPILSAEGVDAYFNGHDHILQHIYNDNVHYFGTGAGARKHVGVDKSYTGLLGYLEGSYGFTVNGISKNLFSTSFIDQSGAVTYSYNITK